MSAYDEFRTALAGLDSDRALIARHYAACSLDELAAETDRRVESALAAAVYDAKHLSAERCAHQVANILASVR